MRNRFAAPRVPLDLPRSPAPGALRPLRGWLASLPLFAPIGWLAFVASDLGLRIRLESDSPTGEPLVILPGTWVAAGLVEYIAFVVLNFLIARRLDPLRGRSFGAFVPRMTLILLPVTAGIWSACAFWSALGTRPVLGPLQLLVSWLACTAVVEVSVLPVSCLWFAIARPSAPRDG